MRRSSGLYGLIATLLLCGCASTPILPFHDEAPAQVLTPIHAAGIKDGRARFRQIFCERFEAAGPSAQARRDCLDYLQRLTDEPGAGEVPAPAPVPLQGIRFVVVSGFFGDVPLAGMRILGPSIDALARKGYRIEYLEVSGGGGDDYNAEQIAAHFRERSFPEDEKLVVVGYSKGAMDLLHFLVRYPQLAQHVDAMVGYVGAINGSPLAEINPKNDGQLIFYDQIVPGSTLLGYANGDHWAVAMPFTEEAGGYAFLADKNDFPRDALFEAVLLYVRESL